MDGINRTVLGIFSKIWARFYKNQSSHKYNANEAPLRSELFSAEQMQQHGKILAGMHELKPGRSRDNLLARLAQNEKILLKIHSLLTEDIKGDIQITPAGEWLLDNFYLIEDQIRTAKLHLPRGYSRELPHLLSGPSAGLVRVYDIALETISHGDGRVDPESLSSFVCAYQSVTTLKLGELWAIPIMLRLALIENLRRVATRIAADRIDRHSARHWADQMTEIAAQDPKSLILTIADMARSNPPIARSFVAELTRRLQGQGPALALPLTWIEQLLSETGLTIEQLVRSENQQQAADQVSMSNSIGSLRLLSAIDWREFVEANSLVEERLKKDPSGAYANMDFATRDQYRHCVEKIAKRSSYSESEVALKAVDLARGYSLHSDQGTEKLDSSDNRRSHVGFYLIDEGLAELERTVNMRVSPYEILRKFGSKFSLALYTSAIILLAGLATQYLLTNARADGLPDLWLLPIAILFFICSSSLAVAIVNWLATQVVAPRLLARMDFSKGIPQELSTLVVVPSMLTTKEKTERLVELLEVRFLANRDDNLHFALLTDFCDANEEMLPEDEPLLRVAKKNIEDLNAKYANTKSGTRFFLFHRPRLWNPSEKIWMGYERKRGKLADLNALLRTRASDRFALIVGDTSVLPEVKYVITLDADTQLARDSAWQFVGAMAHPLNRPYYDEDKHRVVRGYGIIQPQVAMSLQSSNWSLYANMCASTLGIDPYTRAVSDVYQDLFGEGSFIGKGIYEVDVVTQALSNRFPDNKILSHDLLEGSYARAGLLSDVALYEDHPSAYLTDVGRRHRWIRGDWQIARWVMPYVPGADGQLQRNPLSILSRWKMLDNLRRSLTAAGLTLMLLLGWTVLGSTSFFCALFWTSVVIGIITIPSLISLISNIAHKPADMSLGQHLSATWNSTCRNLAQDVFTIVCLPYEAFFSLDALVRTAWRMSVTHKLLLQWNPSDNSDSYISSGLFYSLRAMWIGPAIAVSSIAILLTSNSAVLFVAAPILCLWLASPIITWWLSQPITRRKENLTVEQVVFLRKITRKIWSFFETFVGPEDNWLPPDNYQEHPVAVIAHRTSPTNIGLALLANLSAYDFGYVSAGRLISLTENSFRTMNELERYKGHFYNWYDTKSLKPLIPFYISAVDSGNLAGYLLTLRTGLLEIPNKKILGERFFEGLADTLGILIDAASSDKIYSGKDKLMDLKQEVDLSAHSKPTSLVAYRLYLDRLVRSAATLVADIEALNLNSGSKSQLVWWANAFHKQCQDALYELMLLAPWVDLLSGENKDSGEEHRTLYEIPTLNEIAQMEDDLPISLAHDHIPSGNASAPETSGQAPAGEFQLAINRARQEARMRIAQIQGLASQCGSLADMDYDFLYDDNRHLLAIGYNVSESRRDSSYYDLLASEARFSSFVGIAQGKLPQETWFALGRLLTTSSREPILLSWSGSMFEYLMPLLVMPTYEHTLLDQTYKSAVALQIEHGKKNSVPWGISESGYNAIDVHLNYQYRAFGVPGLGLKRGLAEDLVIAPYASMLALMVSPEEACINLKRLSNDGLEARYGFYEAIDYTASRLPRGQSSVVIRSFMAHHQGMSILSLANLLLEHPMQKRFGSDPVFQATLLLLQERVPKSTALYAHTTELAEHHISQSAQEMPIRIFTNPDTANPQVQLLSNGRYHVMVTNAGGGYSRWKDIDVSRWREDPTCDNWGTFCYLRDLSTGDFWSTAYQPTLKRSKHFEAIFSEGRAEFRDMNCDYETHTEIAVSPEDDIELRRVRITNRGRVRRTIEITSYAEVVIAPSAADALHPAFSNLFVQTEIIEKQRAILCTRRPRSNDEQLPWMLHLMAVHGGEVEEVSYETDRMQFIGRGNTVVDPQVMQHGAYATTQTLSGRDGSVLDPIVAIRHRITLDPQESTTVNMVFGIAESRDLALNLVEKYQDLYIADRVFDLAWTHGQVLLRQINASDTDAELYSHLASSIIYANASVRANQSIITKNSRGQSGLWGYAISGDLPIVLLQIQDLENINLVHHLVQAHAYWRLKGLAVDLVIWNEDHAGYRQLLNDKIMSLIAAGTETNVTDRPGGIFLRPADQISEEDRILIQTVARVIIKDSRGSLSDQIGGRIALDINSPLLTPTRHYRSEPQARAPSPREDLTFYNGLGGFTPDGREYVITTTRNCITPAPWVNVLANPKFGTVVSESGLAYTWSGNAHEFRITPWGNDPVTDSRGEALYLRDEELGCFWSPTPLPSRGAANYVTRHGFGYSVFEHTERDISSELWVYVALDASVKFSVLKVRNNSKRPRRISATGYAELVLGDLKHKSAMHVVTEIDTQTGAIFARNPYNAEFRDQTAFFDVDDVNRTASCDRTEFLGRNGTLGNPAAMGRIRLSGKVGAALDPCAAIRVNFDLAPGQEREVVFRLGVGENAHDARTLVNHFRGSTAAGAALNAVWQHWTHTLGAVNVETPDQSLNVMANGWLLYQTISCRLWARSATYQSGGAFGFRDQLQDVMALIHSSPHLVREHLLLCATRQFLEGDVQHWWHPPTGRGVRTHCSDDYLWLALGTCRYVMSTGDTGVLDENSHFLQGRSVNADEDSYYDLPVVSQESASLYNHCVRAIKNGLKFGPHGLPLIGSGDWNDGMNLVGKQGSGESVWLGFFLYEVLMRFSEVARLHGDLPFAQECTSEAAQLQHNLQAHGWDGKWYRRAYFDDGSPLGSATNSECQIDSISQSWAVLSGAAEAERSRMAMESVDTHLFRREDKLIRLLDPPFDKSDLNPGYIKGYVPGVRENGGQYTHAAVWAAMAYARLGDNQRAWELFRMINPVNHGRSKDEVAIYKVEPYVVAADVYAVDPHTGRGGWTWYTGSASWMYRLIVESLLGLQLETNKLHIRPCLPADWKGFKLHYRYRQTVYHISVSVSESHTQNEKTSMSVDGIEQEDEMINLVDDRGEHWVEVSVPAYSEGPHSMKIQDHP